MSLQMWLNRGWALVGGTIEKPVEATTRKGWCRQEENQHELQRTAMVTAGVCVLPEHSWMDRIESVRKNRMGNLKLRRPLNLGRSIIFRRKQIKNLTLTFLLS